MSVAARVVLVLLGSLAVGSWFGLGKPGTEEAGTLVPPALGGEIAHAPQPTEAPVDADPPEPTGDMPSIAPWPTLNAEASISRAWMVAEGPRHEPGDGRRLVTLTFDDGPFLETTPAVLKVLAREKIHATFFVVGEYLDGDDKRGAATRALLRRIVDAGHLVGNHTHDHAHLAQITHTQALEQIDQGAASIERAIGKKPIFFRPPYGELDDFGRKAIIDRRLDMLLWSVEASDMTRDDAHEMFHELTQQLDYKEGGIVLLHDIRFTSIAALRELLGWLRDRPYDPSHPAKVGYEIVDLPTYLRAVAAAPLPYATRDDLERAREAASRVRHKRTARAVVPGDG